jgi:hypothetical protein
MDDVFEVLRRKLASAIRVESSSIIDMNGESGDSGEKDEEILRGGCCLATGMVLVSG